MAQQVMQLNHKLSCSICLDLLKDPVTIPCGHSYCMRCIKDCWKAVDEQKLHSCPQCRQSFTSVPTLVKNTMLAELVEELEKTGLHAAASDESCAGPGDVACDFCTEVKLKAVKSCLVCVASYCEQHLQPHYSVAPLKKHSLVEATVRLQENICSRHDEVMKIFCRTDQEVICYLCSMDDHRGHDTVPAAAERAVKQEELGESQEKIQQRIQERMKDIMVLQQKVKSINLTANAAVRDSEKVFTEMIRLIQRRSSEVTQQIRLQQKSEASRAKEHEKKLQQEIAELWGKHLELDKLSHTEDHLHFLKSFPSMSHLSESKDLPIIEEHLLCSFQGVAAAMLEARGKVEAVLTEQHTKISQTVSEVEVFLPPAEPSTRAEFLRFSCQLTLDPNTAHARLSLRDTNRKALLRRLSKTRVPHPDRFLKRHQVLSRQGLSGRCYWEVRWTGVAHIAAAYRDVCRAGPTDECGFGDDDKSWALVCEGGSFRFRHNNISTPVFGHWPSRVGVYLDYKAGTLSFYSVCDTMVLLHRVQTSFTQPLCAGFRLPHKAGSAEFCQLR